jgi:Holliday junction DNA helicase RuvB
MFDKTLEFIFGVGDLIWDKKEQSQEKEIYHSEQVKPMIYSFRPRNLDEYIGQENAKELVRLNIQKVMSIKPVHFLISGARGHGKSTLAYIIANSLGFKIHTYIGGVFTMENLKSFLIGNESGEPHILFIDEIHGLPKDMAEFLYPLLEDFWLPVGNIEVRPFIFIGATTEKNILLKKFSPLVDRCGCQINLEHYKSDNIKTILKQYNNQTHNSDVSEEIYDILSVNTRYNPRTSIAMFDDFIVCKDIEKVLNAHRIVKNSLTTDDILILKHLTEINKPVGMETLAIVIQQTNQDYTAIIEPFLIQQGYLSRRARGRVITEKGKLLLQEVENGTK